MERFEIAGLTVAMNCSSGMTYDRSRAYLSDKVCDPDITIDIPERIVTENHKRYSTLSSDECRYLLIGEVFYYNLIDYNGVMLHSSCIEKDGEAYLFSAYSGVGKSTHTHLWMKMFDDVSMINDDKPAIRKIDGKYMACGTPFSGKNDESKNELIPIKAIIFVERSETNHLEHISAGRAIPLVLAQTIRPSRLKKLDKMLEIIDGLLTSVPVFKMHCNMEDDAPIVAYNGVQDYFKNIED